MSPNNTSNQIQIKVMPIHVDDSCDHMVTSGSNIGVQRLLSAVDVSLVF